MDPLNAALAVAALVLAAVAIFVTRNHRHDLIWLGVPLLGIGIAVIPLVRIMRQAHERQEQIDAGISAADNSESAFQGPCVSRGGDMPADPPSLSPAAIAAIASELRTISPGDLLLSDFLSLLVGILGSFLAAFLYAVCHQQHH